MHVFSYAESVISSSILLNEMEKFMVNVMKIYLIFYRHLA